MLHDLTGHINTFLSFNFVVFFTLVFTTGAALAYSEHGVVFNSVRLWVWVFFFQRDDSWSGWDIIRTFLSEKDTVKTSDLRQVRKWLHPSTRVMIQHRWCVLVVFDCVSCSVAMLLYLLNKSLAIANRSRVSCAHNTSRAFIGLITPWPWNLG